MDSISSYVELVEPQSYSKGHKSSSAYTTSFKIVAEGLRSWVQLRCRETQEKDWQG